MAHATFHNRRQHKYITQRISNRKSNGQDSSHMQGSTTEEQSTKMIGQIRWNKKQYNDKSIPHVRFHNRRPDRKISHREDRKQTATESRSISQARFLNRRQHKDIAHREDRKQTAQGQVFQRQVSTTEKKKKWYRTQRRSKRNSTRPSISQARFHNRRQKDRHWTEKKKKWMMTPRFIGDKVPKEMMKKAHSGLNLTYKWNMPSICMA